jgi:hypothetical protein
VRVVIAPDRGAYARGKVPQPYRPNNCMAEFGQPYDPQMSPLLEYVIGNIVHERCMF